MNCSLCGKQMIVDEGSEHYDNYGTKANYYFCEDDNCEGKHTELCFPDNITLGKLKKLLFNTDNYDEEIQIINKMIEILN